MIANDEIDFDEMTEETQSIARDILENVKVLDDEMYRKYTELRQMLRNTPVMINDRYENDFRAVGTFAEFKKKNRGRINIVKEKWS